MEPKFDFEQPLNGSISCDPSWEIGKFVCPTCNTDRLQVYYRVGWYSTWARCPDCDVDMEVHSG